MHNRIELIIKTAGIKKVDFARRLNVSQAFVSQICSGAAKPSDRTIADICRVFNVNRQYLEQGQEPMFLPAPDLDTDFINELLEKIDSPFVDIIRATVRVYMELPPEDQRKFDTFAASLRDKLNQENRD